jgi:hypothetical protein
MTLKEFGMKLSWPISRHYPNSRLKGLTKATNTLDILRGIRIGRLPNTSQKPELTCSVIWDWLWMMKLENSLTTQFRTLYSKWSDKMKNTVFWDITPFSPLKVTRCFGETYRLHLQGRRISRAEFCLDLLWFCLTPAFKLLSCSAYSFTLKMDATCSSEISGDFQLTTRRYTQETVLFISTAVRISHSTCEKMIMNNNQV